MQQEQLDNLIQISSRYSKIKKQSEGEYLGLAYLIYLQAREKYREDKGDFRKWITYKINRDLRSRKHPYDRYKKKYIRRDSIPDRARFELSRFLMQLSKDAQFVVLLSINPPLEVMLLKGRIKRHAKKAIKEFLRLLHWSYARIYRAFDEIRDSLQGGR